MENLTKQRSCSLQLNLRLNNGCHPSDECHLSGGELETLPSGTESGQTLVWDDEKGEWVVGSVAQATETQAGVARIATAMEVEAGMDDETFVTPAKLAGAISALKIERVGKIDLVEYAPAELAEHMPGWYFANGDLFPLTSPQGQVLNGLPAAYKTRWGITVSGSNISLPKMFHTDGRGYYFRAGDGSTKAIGSVEGDAIRNISGRSAAVWWAQLVDWQTGAFGGENIGVGVPTGGTTIGVAAANFDASRVVPTANENRVLTVYKTPAIYLGV